MIDEVISKKYKTIERLAGDASSRVYYLDHSNEKKIVCHYPKELKYSFDDFIQITNLLKNKIKVPKIYDVDEENLIIEQEYLGDTFVGKIDPSTNDFLELYEKILDDLIEFSKSSLESIGINRKFDKEKFDFESNMTIKYFINTYLKSEKYEQEFVNIFNNINDTLNSNQKYFSHRDFHSRNIMLLNECPVYIDYQDARYGQIYYDLCSLLEDSYVYIDGDTKERLLKYFYHRYSDLEDISYEDFLQNYHLSNIQRLFKAIGSFSYLYYEKETPIYLRYISKAFGSLIESCSYTQNDSLRALLLKVYNG